MCLTNLCEIRFRQGIPAERFFLLIIFNFIYFFFPPRLKKHPHRESRFSLPPLSFFCFSTAAAARNFN